MSTAFSRDFRRQLSENKNVRKPSAAKIQSVDSSFWLYRAYADIRGGSVDRRRQKAVGYFNPTVSVTNI